MAPDHSRPTRRTLLGTAAAAVAAGTLPAQALAEPRERSGDSATGQARLVDVSPVELPTDLAIEGPPTVTVDERSGTVTVAGATRVPTPCHEPLIAGASVDDDRNELRLALDATTPDEDEQCPQVVVSKPYGVRARFAAGLPESIEIAEGGHTHRVDVADLPGTTTLVGDALETAEAEFPPECAPRLTGSRATQTMRVRGAMRLGSPCTEIRMPRCEYVPEYDAVVVEFEPVQPDDATCAQVTTDRGYDLAMRCNGGLPGRLVVREGDEGTYVYDVRR